MNCEPAVPSELTVNVDESTVQQLTERHWDNVVKVYRLWKEPPRDPEKLCILMDWQGDPLSFCLSKGFRWSGPPWYDIMRGIANGIGQAHLNSFVHGDLKPSNGFILV